MRRDESQCHVHLELVGALKCGEQYGRHDAMITRELLTFQDLVVILDASRLGRLRPTNDKVFALAVFHLLGKECGKVYSAFTTCAEDQGRFAIGMIFDYLRYPRDKDCMSTRRVCKGYALPSPPI